jgi:hypothetical protein
MRSPTAPRNENRALLTAGWIIVLTAFFALRLIRGEALINADELIPIKVAEAMSARGTLDPNWSFADLGLLQYDSYNFYFYNVLAFFLIKPAQWLGLPPLGVLRVANIAMQLATLWFARAALRRIGAHARSRLLGCALIAVAPGLVQDAYMARPESLIYLLVALLIWILTLDIALISRMAWAGLVLGAGMAVKVTFASAGLLVLVPLAESWRQRSLREWSLCAALLGVCALVGFAIAAPYALVYPAVFLSGLAHLADQYRSGQPPHSLPAYSFAGQAFWISRYFIELYGPLLPIAAAGPLWMAGRARRWAIGLAACWLVLAIYFATQRVFFERNFAHGLVPLLFAAALAVQGIKFSSARYLLAAAMLLPMTYWSLQIAIATRSAFRPQAYESSHNLTVTHRVGLPAEGQDQNIAGCQTVAIIDYNDPWSRNYVAKLQADGFELIGHYRGRFAPLVTSTLHTYLDPGAYYLKCPKPQ